MAAPKRTKVERERDLVLIAERYLRGDTQSQIARTLGISQPQVTYDLAEIRQRWRASTVRDFEEARVIELTKINNLEATYWAAWERSLLPKEHVTTERAAVAQGDRARVSVRTEKSEGNPAFLTGVLHCIDRRTKLLGLDAPQQSDLDVSLTWVEQAQRARQQVD